MSNKENINKMIDKMKDCEQEIAKAIIGQEEVVHEILLAILADGNVLLEGVPGLGKTQLVKTISKVLDLSFSRIQFTPDLMPADVTGTNLIIKENGNNVFKFEQGPVFANIVLADEINRATPKTQAAMLEAMQEKTVTSGKNTYPLPMPYMVLATQNPIENEGTYPLPEAQLDRFVFKINMEFPNLNELKKIMKRKEKITVSFVVDRYGYAATTLESKTVDKFILQMSNELHDWILDYLVKGEITMPIPSSKERLLKDMAKDSNELATNTLTNFLNGNALRYIHVVPEIADKPDRLTVTFAFPYGIIVFKVRREKEIVDELTSKGF